MDYLNLLRSRLPRGRGQVFAQDPLTELEEQATALTTVLNGRTPTADTDEIADAVDRFTQELRFRHSKDALLVCLGCDMPVGKRKYRLIEDETTFPAVLSGVDPFRKHPQAFRDCYRGLLDAYLGYHPGAKSGSPKAWPNWTQLRHWLSTGVRDVRDSDFEEEWVAHLGARPELFSENPVDSFGERLLEDDDTEFLNFTRALAISKDSWFMEMRVFAEIRAAAASRRGIEPYLPRLQALLLDVVSQNPELFNQALAEVINHYHAQSADGAVHEDLRDLTQDYWGNPLNDDSAGGWSLVDGDALDMVRKWFARHVIEQFFSVLAKQSEFEDKEKRKKRQRRLQYWVQYAEVAGNVKFALGPHARTDDDPRMRKVLASIKNLTMSLNGGGDRQNNAFIMRFGEWVVVEFGLESNACFIYRASDLPFDREDRSISTQDIKSHIQNSAFAANGPMRLEHRDSYYGDRTWEEDFTKELERRGITLNRSTTKRPRARWTPQVQNSTRPTVAQTQSAQFATGRSSSASAASRILSLDTAPLRPTQVEIPRPSQVEVPSGLTQVETRPSSHIEALSQMTQVETRRTSAARNSAPVFGDKEERELIAFCRRFSIPVRDMREREGNLWVVHDSEADSRLTVLLNKYGFNYRPGKGWWYPNPKPI
jgi:hypothetical protein